MTAPRPGDRRQREGRCERCGRPLSDLEWNASPPMWVVAQGGGTQCMGGACDAVAIWRARAKQAEAERDAAFADGARHGLLAAAMLLDPLNDDARRHYFGRTPERGRPYWEGVMDATDSVLDDMDDLLALASDGGGDA